MKENNHNTRIVYLLNCIDKHIHSIEMFLACLKINVKHLKNIDVEMCRLWPVTSQCTKLVVPYSSNVCENSLVQWNVWIHRLLRENVSTMSSALVGRNFSSVDILLTFTLCQCNVMTLLNNLSGTGAWCFSTSTSVTTVLGMPPCISSCLWVNVNWALVKKITVKSLILDAANIKT